jgi:hypothetical protein
MSAYWYSPLLQSTLAANNTQVFLDGISVTGAVGFLQIGTLLTGVAGTTNTGTLTLHGVGNVSLTGTEAAGLTGTIGGLEVRPTGVEAISSIGNVDVFLGSGVTIELTGVNTTAYFNGLRSWTDIQNSPPTRWIDIN